MKATLFKQNKSASLHHQLNPRGIEMFIPFFFYSNILMFDWLIKTDELECHDINLVKILKLKELYLILQQSPK
jgi:hypothetical protein